MQDQTNQCLKKLDHVRKYIRSADAKIETIMFWTKKSHIIVRKNKIKIKSLEKSTVLGVVKGRRGKGRPHMHWMDGVKAETNPSLLELRKTVQDTFGEI